MIIPSSLDLSQKFFGNVVVIYTWTALVQLDDTGAPVSGPGWADRSFQVEGTFGAGGTVVIEGSNDGTNYRTLNDPYGNPMSITSPGLYQLTQDSLFVRPRLSVADDTSSITVSGLFARHGYP